MTGFDLEDIFRLT